MSLSLTLSRVFSRFMGLEDGLADLTRLNGTGSSPLIHSLKSWHRRDKPLHPRQLRWSSSDIKQSSSWTTTVPSSAEYDTQSRSFMDESKMANRSLPFSSLFHLSHQTHIEKFLFYPHHGRPQHHSLPMRKRRAFSSWVFPPRLHPQKPQLPLIGGL